ncbi:MAG: hypothetical protein AB1894_03540 [Chloroflexota bacterium]
MSNDTTDWKVRFEDEIHHAEDARADGNEGMARVCARRAAGIAIGEYLRRQGMPTGEPSAYERLKNLRLDPRLPPDLVESVEHLLLRVTPEHNLPVQADLIAEARRLSEGLLGAR